ncbi:MAG TPA: adenylate/guanylate cyclase domain-containing protein [Jatrophihabitantaceae bacterium]
MSRCINCGADLAAGARFCAQCGTAVDEADGRAEARKTVTVVFCDLTDSTGLGERLDAEAFQRVMVRYYGLMRDCVRRHGGVVEKFIGDAVMAAFGVPQVHEDDALRAVRAAIEMRSSVALINIELPQLGETPIQVRIGINTGEVVTLGTPDARQVLTSGDTVNTAARLQQVASPEEIFLGAGTRAVLDAAVRTEPVVGLTLKGKADPVTAHRLLGLDDDAEAVARNFDLPLVDRDRELRQLRLVLDRSAHERSGHLVTIFGEPGLGKSRLVRELIAEARTLGLVCGYGACRPYGQGHALTALADAFRELLSDHAGATAGGQTSAATSSDALAVLRDGLLRDATPGGSDDQLRWAVLEVLELLAADRVIVLVIDDIHWAQPALLDLLEHIADWSKGGPVVLACCARPELLESRPGWAGGLLDSTALTLGPLRDADCYALIAATAEVEMHNVELVDRIVGRAEGNPLYLEQLLQMVQDDASARLPPTVSALIMARLDRLAPDDHELLLCAAVVGPRFTVERLAVVVDDGLDAGRRARLEDSLRGLCRRRLFDSIRPDSVNGQRRYAFASTLIQEVAYAAVPKSIRAGQHERLARWIADLTGVSDDAGEHLERAYELRTELGEPEEQVRALRQGAAHHLAASGSRAVRRGDVNFAASALSRAFALSRRGDPERSFILERYGETRQMQGETAHAVQLWRDVLDSGPDAEPVTLAHARLELALIDSANGGLARSAEVAREVLPTFEEAHDHFGLGRAWLRIGQARQAEGQYLDAGTALEHALDQVLRVDAELERGRVVGALATSLLLGPRPVAEALTRVHDLADRYVVGRPSARAAVSYPLGMLYAIQGDFDEARELVGISQRIVQDLGQVLSFVVLEVYAASVELLAGRGPSVVDQLRTSQVEATRIGDRRTELFAARYRARALFAAGELDDALAVLEGVDLAGAAPTWAADLYGVRGRIHALQDRPDAARADVARSTELALSTDSLASHGLAHLDGAHVLRRVGEDAAADRSAQAARHAFAAKGHQVGLRDVDDYDAASS